MTDEDYFAALLRGFQAVIVAESDPDASKRVQAGEIAGWAVDVRPQIVYSALVHVLTLTAVQYEDLSTPKKRRDFVRVVQDMFLEHVDHYDQQLAAAQAALTDRKN